MNNNLGFDPILFLGLAGLDKKSRPEVNRQLLDRISDYIATRTIEILPERYLGQVYSIDKVFTLALEHIPGYHSKIKQFLADFKQEFSRK